MIPKSQDAKDANVLGGRLVLVVKYYGSPDENSKARFISQGHKYKDKPYMVHYTAKLWSTFVHPLGSIAYVNGFLIFSHDFNQMYVQSKDKLTRQILLLPKKEYLKILVISREEILELFLSLYSI